MSYEDSFWNLHMAARPVARLQKICSKSTDQSILADLIVRFVDAHQKTQTVFAVTQGYSSVQHSQSVTCLLSIATNGLTGS